MNACLRVFSTRRPLLFIKGKPRQSSTGGWVYCFAKTKLQTQLPHQNHPRKVRRCLVRVHQGGLIRLGWANMSGEKASIRALGDSAEGQNGRLWLFFFGFWICELPCTWHRLATHLWWHKCKLPYLEGSGSQWQGQPLGVTCSQR